MSLRFYLNENNQLIMEYFPYMGGVSFFIESVSKKTNSGSSYLFKNTFNIDLTKIVNPENFEEENEDSIEIIVGNYNIDDGYIYLDKDVFDIQNDFAFSGDITIYPKYLLSNNVSLIKTISKTIQRNIFIDSNRSDVGDDGHIPISKYKEIIKKIPNRYEFAKYTKSAVQELLEDFFDVIPDYKVKYEEYLKKKRNYKYKDSFPKSFYELKIEEYSELYNELDSLLKQSNVSEDVWQNKIIDIIRIIYPKYIIVIPKFEFQSLGKTKIPDFLVIDSDGDVDVIEIKKADIGTLLKKYRDNYVPKQELSGAIVQAEQYTYFLKSEKKRIENFIKTKYANIIGNLEINIINPHGIVIAGRSDYMNIDEKNDFEIIKRMHKNISEIITYDDLLKRLKNIIDIFSLNSQRSGASK